MNNINLNDIYNKCLEFIEQIKNPILKDCCKKIYSDYKDKLFNKPGTNTHHYYKGGLLYHIYCVTRNAITITNLYGNLDVDLDLIIFGSLTHDIGKTKDFNDFTDDESYIMSSGNSADLLGHSYEGAHIVENYLSNYDIDEQFKNQVVHMIGSHMNEYSEGGALVMPKMLEVIIISYADNIDSHLEPAHEILSLSNKGEKYKIINAPREYYKSLNPYYNKK